MLPELPEQADHTPYTHRKRAAAAHCVSLSQAPPDCTRCPEPARRPSSLCYLCRPACSASLQGGTVQAIMSATVPPGLCESSQAHSGAFVFRIPGLPQFLYPYPSLQSARSTHSLMPGRAMPRRWVLRMRAGDCVSPAAPGESLLMMSRDQAGPGRLRAQRSPPCLNHPGTVLARPWHAIRLSLRCQAPGCPARSREGSCGSVRHHFPQE